MSRRQLRLGRRMDERDKYENSLGDGHDDYYGDRQAVTPTRLRRKMGADRERDRERDQNPHDEGNDGWIWGRYKSGGGGAPLRDVDGNNVANLRLVHHDSVQLQHSPTHSPKKSLRHGSVGHDHDDPYYSRGSNYRSNDDYDYGERVTAIPGLTDRSHPKYSGGNPSPKKFMSSLREITTNMTKEELDAKNRKEYAYKAQLKKQVDEKKREKFAEKRKAEELKRRELEEYYRSYYRGNIPPEKMRELRRPIIVEGEEEIQDKDAIIMNLKKTGGSKGGLSKAGKEAIGKTPQRSQSVHNIVKPEGRVKGAANAGAKPKSASAFGRKAPDPPPKREKQPTVAKEPKSFVEMSAAGLNRIPKVGRKALAGSKLTAKQDKLPSGGGDSRTGVGVGKLQLGIRGNQAPKIVSHEKDDEDYSARGGGGLRAMQRKVNKVGFKESVEMPGASEYLHNNEGEALSEDQLDRLLIQAKKTRGYDVSH